VIRSPAEAKNSSSSLYVKTGCDIHPEMGIGGAFPGSKARPGRDANHSPPPSTTENKNEKDLKFLSPLAPAWRSGRTLIFTFSLLLVKTSIQRLFILNCQSEQIVFRRRSRLQIRKSTSALKISSCGITLIRCSLPL
jgi:hypothetical protein